jgi:DNA-binding IclR family transcriptional regulator
MFLLCEHGVSHYETERFIMIKVLDKAFGILELLAIASPDGIKPGRIATLLNINNATCSRILKDLSDVGYVEKVSREAGYTIGPRALTFSKQISYNAELDDAAELCVEECARKLKCSVILVELKNNQRYILLHHDYYPNSSIVIDELSYTDLFKTATGVLLLANTGIEERDKAVKQYDLPDKLFFEGVSDRKEYYKVLDEVKEKGYAYYDKETTSIYAVPIFKEGKVIAVLGTTFIGGLANNKNKESILNEVSRTAEKINKKMLPINYIG